MGFFLAKINILILKKGTLTCTLKSIVSRSSEKVRWLGLLVPSCNSYIAEI